MLGVFPFDVAVVLDREPAVVQDAERPGVGVLCLRPMLSEVQEVAEPAAYLGEALG